MTASSLSACKFELFDASLRDGHQQLLAHRGLYWKLYQLQYKDQEVAA